MGHGHDEESILVSLIISCFYALLNESSSRIYQWTVCLQVVLLEWQRSVCPHYYLQIITLKAVFIVQAPRTEGHSGSPSVNSTEQHFEYGQKNAVSDFFASESAAAD